MILEREMEAKSQGETQEPLILASMASNLKGEGEVKKRNLGKAFSLQVSEVREGGREDSLDMIEEESPQRSQLASPGSLGEEAVTGSEPVCGI